MGGSRLGGKKIVYRKFPINEKLIEAVNHRKKMFTSQTASLETSLQGDRITQWSESQMIRKALYVLCVLCIEM